MTVLQILFYPFQFFMASPALILLPALFFWLLYLFCGARPFKFDTLRPVPLFLAAILWTQYALWEFHEWWTLESRIVPIRVDLLFMVPTLYLISVAGIISYFAVRRHKQREARGSSNHLNGAIDSAG